MFERVTTKGESQEARVDISPLIDVVFLLLIFFMVTAVFVEETGVDIDKPAAVSAHDLERNSILLAITTNDEIYFDQRPIPLDQLRGLIARLLRERHRPVVLLADEQSRSGILVRVIDACKLGGADQISVATRQ